MAIDRRTFLIGGAAVGVVAVGAVGGGFLVEAGVLPGRSKLDEALGRCGSMLEPPDVVTGPVITGTFSSSARNGSDVGWTVVYPPGSSPGDALPVCLFLHGRGGSNADSTGSMQLPRFLAGVVADDGVAPFAIASVDGGDATNWHRRSDGDDPPAMIAGELLPLLASKGLDVGRLAFWGVSLGGTGALYLATLPDFEPAGVMAASPALWREPGEWQAGAYDDEVDFEDNSLWNRLDLLDGVNLRIDCGESDPFASRVRQFCDGLNPTPAGGIEPGCHDNRFWSRQTPAEIAFVGAALAEAARPMDGTPNGI